MGHWEEKNEIIGHWENLMGNLDYWGLDFEGTENIIIKGNRNFVGTQLTEH